MERNDEQRLKRQPAKMRPNGSDRSTGTIDDQPLASSSEDCHRDGCYQRSLLNSNVHITADTRISEQQSDNAEHLHHKSDLISARIGRKKGTQSDQIPSTSGMQDTRHLIQLQRHQQKRLCTRLPIYAMRDEIQQQVKANQIVIVKGQTGCGKSTQIPQYVTELNIGKVICTQPTKLAATSLAYHLTQEYPSTDSSIDSIVNHSSLHQKLHNNSMITFVTDCIFLDILVGDPTLSSYGCVIVDQVHQRSLYTDVLLAFLKQVLTHRHDLKLVIISEHVDTQLFSDYFNNCPVISISEKQFPVDIKWCNVPVKHYFDKALDTIVDIHNENEKGDILVFLVTPDEIEKACIDIKKRVSNHRDSIIAMPLHDDLQATDLQHIFNTDLSGPRKIIFTTSYNETSMIIPGIRYVIDTGLIQERIYDERSHGRVLRIHPICQHSAIQRCSHVRHIPDGVCYRLYSQQVYDNMSQSAKPEIMRIHLLNVFLKMIELGIIDIINFNFIESPLLQSMNDSLDTLFKLSAITTSAPPLSLTSKGKLFCQLPLEPKISALIMNTKEWNMLPEGIIIASVLSISCNLQCHYGSGKDKCNLDSIKTQFCYDDGDVISTADIYIKWRSLYEKGEHDNWCYENRINQKLMQHLDDKVCELYQSLYYLDIINQIKPIIPAQLKSQTRDKLRQLVFQCYHDRLALFTGIDKIGYIIINSNKQYLIHTSSNLFSLGVNPKYIIYQDILITDDHFLINVTPVDEEWLQSMENCNNYIKMTNTLNNVVVTQTIDHLGSIILSKCNINNINKMIKKFLQDMNIRYNIVKNFKDGKLQITTIKSRMPILLNIISEFIMHKKEKLTKTIKILSKEDDNAPRLIIGRGIIINDILLSSDYIEFKITLHYTGHDNPDEGTVVDVINELRSLILSCGELAVDIDSTDVIKSKDYKNIRFDKIVYQELRSQSLLKALDKQIISGYVINIEDGSLANCSISRDRIVVQFCWPKSPRIGTASISCRDHLAAVDVYDDFPLTVRNYSIEAIIDMDSPNTLFMDDIPKSITAPNIRKAIPEGHRRVITGIHIHREAINDDNSICSANLESALRHLLDKNGYHGTYSDIIIKPMSLVQDNPNIIADVVFREYDNAVWATHTLDGEIFEELINEPISVRLSHSRIIRCQHKIYAYVNEEINRVRESAQSIDGDDEECVDIDIEGSGKHSLAWITIFITSWNELRLNEIVHLISKIIEPVKVPIQEIEILQYLDSKDGKTVLKSLTDPFVVYTKIDWNSQCILIYGVQQVKEQALQHCQKQINVLLSKYNIINLVGNNKPRDLVKVMIKRYGVNMIQLRQLSGADVIRLNRQNNTLVVISDKESFEKISHEIDLCCSTLQSTEESSDEISANDCVACFCQVDEDNYRLQYCGHLYCQQCITEQMNSAIRSFSFPLNCADCNQGFVIADLERLLMKSPQPQLFDVLTTEFIRRHPNMWHYCPTPECELVYKRSENCEIFTCPKCQRKTCRECDTDAHPGYDCNGIVLFRHESHSIQRFINENSSRVKNCPQCNAAIEKDDGCNRMECTFCHTQFCWLCLTGYKTADECYQHLQEIHGGVA